MDYEEDGKEDAKEWDHRVILDTLFLRYTNVRDDHILQGSGLSSDLAVKIQPPGGQTPLFQHSLHKHITQSNLSLGVGAYTLHKLRTYAGIIR